MLRKLDFQCHRVKSISFHPYRYWIVCGLHTGVIYMIDYRLDSVVDVFVEHSRSVRAIDFHSSQPLFVSGADDCLIKVWNYNLRRCLFTLSGHSDYIRSTFFHPAQPWIVSASDDKTVRLWNWQNRSCMATLPGHRHFVMCAKFLPRDSQLISCSLDYTIRVWDISTVQEDAVDDFGLAEFLGTADVAVLHEVIAHEKGVNWIDCHPTENYVASASDDHTIRVWKVTDKIFVPVSRIIGHEQNVSCAIFFKNYIISNSEDRIVRVWQNWRGASTPSCISEFRRASDRYWVLAKDEQRNLFAAGHDTGCEIFKIERERPAFTIHEDHLFYTFEGAIRYFNFGTNKMQEYPLSQTLRTPLSMTFNPADSCLAVSRAGETRMISVNFVEGKANITTNSFTVLQCTNLIPNGHKKYVGKSPSGTDLVMLSRDQKKVAPIQINFQVSRLFPSTPGTVLCAAENKVYLYHLAQQSVVAEIAVAGVKYAVWDKKFQRVALISKNTITVATKTLSVISIVSEPTVRIKSAVFDETREILFFSTSYHLKYCNIINGDISTISALRNVVYLVRAVGDKIFYISRTGELQLRELDNSELLFKQKLHQKAYREVIQILQRGKLKGQALVGYLHKHKYSEVALQFVKDPLTRFYLALECGVIDIAKEMAAELDDPKTWQKLAETAVLFGDIQLAQMASTKANDYRSTAFLSLITGNTSSMGHLVDVTPDEHFKMQYGLYLDDARLRIRILVDAGQLSLAYLTAKSYELEDLAEAISASLDPAVLERLSQVPCHAVAERQNVEPITENWPMLRVEESIFSRLLKEPAASHLEAEINLQEAGGAWDDDDDAAAGVLDNGGAEEGEDGDENEGAEGAGWGEDEDLDIDVTATLSRAKASGQKKAYVAPAPHNPIGSGWVTRSHEPAYHIAAGSFDTALSILQKQICICNPEPLKPIILKLWSSVNAARPSWTVPSTSYTLTSARDELPCSPALPNMIGMMKDKLKQGFQLFVTGKFGEGLECFKSVLHLAVFSAPESDSERASLKELISQASEYARALSLQIHLKSEDPNSPTALALALYFTHFQLLRPHLVLALSQAMTKSFKKKNFRTAAGVARRLLDQEPPQAKADQATAIIYEAEGKDDQVEVEYDGLNPFTLAPALPDYRNTLCPICKLSALGTEGLGLWYLCEHDVFRVPCNSSSTFFFFSPLSIRFSSWRRL
eukprot:gene4428-3227_t